MASVDVRSGERAEGHEREVREGEREGPRWSLAARTRVGLGFYWYGQARAWGKGVFKNKATQQVQFSCLGNTDCVLYTQRKTATKAVLPRAHGRLPSLSLSDAEHAENDEARASVEVPARLCAEAHNTQSHVLREIASYADCRVPHKKSAARRRRIRFCLFGWVGGRVGVLNNANTGKKSEGAHVASVDGSSSGRMILTCWRICVVRCLALSCVFVRSSSMT